jgi:hypothetical protein
MVKEKQPRPTLKLQDQEGKQQRLRKQLEDWNEKQLQGWKREAAKV